MDICLTPITSCWYLPKGVTDGEEPVADSEANWKDEPLYTGANITAAVSYLLIMAFVIRHGLTGEALIDLLQLIELHCLLPNSCAKSAYFFHKYFIDYKIALKKHYYCKACLALLSIPGEDCPNCGDIVVQDQPFFIELPIAEQLKAMLTRPQFYEKVTSYRLIRQKQCDRNYEDIYDGALYRDAIASDNKNTISLTWNTDGKPLFKSSKYSVWPLYFVINELPFIDRLKQENMLLAGLWYGKVKPAMHTYLEPFAIALRDLETTGIQVHPPASITPVTLKVILLLGTCDKPAKCMVQNFMQFNGEYGCSRCLNPGKNIKIGKSGHTHVYPFETNISLRTHEHTKECAKQAKDSGQAVHGVKGLSWFSTLPTFDLIRGTMIDYMHTVCARKSGVVCLLLNLWFNSKNSSKPWYIGKFRRSIDNSLLKIKPPNVVSRVPRSITEKDKWKASEFRNWLLFYSVPLLQGILLPLYFNHYLIFVSAMYTLLQASISPEDLITAEALLYVFVQKMGVLYGERTMTSNVHDLLHLPQCVRDGGPVFHYSCFFFEDFNRRIANFFHGTQEIPQQIMSRAAFICKMPELNRGVLTNFPIAEALYGHMTETQKYPAYKSVIGNGIYRLGAVQMQPLSPTLQHKIAEFLGLADFSATEVECFTRICIKDKICIDSMCYTRAKKRCSHCIKYWRNGVQRFGLVKFFCTMESEALAIVEELSQTGPFKSDIGIVLNHIIVTSSEAVSEVVIHVSHILCKCVFIPSCSQSSAYIALFPNHLEQD